MATAAARMTTSPATRFVEGLREPRTKYISPERFSKALGINIASFAELTGVHRNTLRKPESERLQARMRQMIKVISAATDLSGDVNKAAYWYLNHPISDYDHRTAAELVAEGHVDAVLDYLGDLETGAND